MKRYFSYILAAILLAVFVIPADAVIPFRMQYGARFRDRGVSHSTPPSGFGDVYVKNDVIYFITDGGVETSMIQGTSSVTLDTAYDAGETIDLDAAGDLEFDLTVTARKIQIANTYAGTQAVALEIDAESAQQITDALLFNTTAGTIIDAIDASDAGITNAINVGANTILGGLAAIDFTEFDVSPTTGSVTINDGGDLGNISIEGTILDINSLDFLLAGEITAAAGAAITINPNAGNVAGEDLIITAHNIKLTAAGALDLTPDGAVVLAIDLTDTNYTNAISVGDNAILGSTGIIDYDNFDVDASGNVIIGGDLTVSGVSILGSLAQDNLVPASASPQAITLNGGGTGKIRIGNSSTGNIELGGGANTVDFLAGTDLVISEGKLAITSTVNENMISITNNTMTDTSLFVGVSTSLTTGKAFSITTDGITSGVMLYLDNDQAGAFTGKYVQFWDGTQSDFEIVLHGVTTIAGDAGNDTFTLDTGDVQITAGDIDIDAGMITLDAAVNSDRSYFKNSADIGAVGASTAMFTLGSTIGGGNTTNTMHILALEFAADGDAQDGYLVLRDNSAADIKFEVIAGGATNWNLDDVILKIDADTVLQSGTAGVIDIDIRSATASHVGILMDYELDDGGSGTQYGYQVSLQDDGAGADETFVAFGVTISSGTNATTVGFEAESYDSAFKATALAAGVILEIDVADSYTARGIDADLGPHIGTVNEGFIHIFTDSAATDVAGQIIRIDLADTLVDTTAISGKAIYAKELSPLKTGTYIAHFESTNNGSLFLSGPFSLQAAAPLVGGSPLVFEGSTVDGFELTIAVTDPESDTTITLPDGPVGGAIGSIVAVGTTTDTETAAATETIDESVIAVPANHAAAGQVYRWIMAGTKIGANNTWSCQLDIGGTNALTLQSPDSAAGDWECIITMYQLNATNSQKISGRLFINGKSPVVDYATAAVDISGGVNIGLELVLVDAGDEVSKETVLVTFNE